MRKECCENVSRVVVALIIASLLWGCDRSSTETISEPASQVESETADSVGSAQPAANEAELGERIVIAGGTLTEIAFALGAGDRVVAVDSSSTHPPEVKELESIGFFRRLAAEPILSTRPSALLMTSAAGPENVVEQLQKATRVELVDDGETIDAAVERIEHMGRLLNAQDAASQLVQTLRTDLERAEKRRDEQKDLPRVLFIYARGPNVTMVAGQKTGAQTMLELAGAQNSIEGIEGFKPLTAEAVAAAQPQVIVMPRKSASGLGGWEGVKSLPGVEQTPAGQNKNIVLVDDLALLGFGPRMGHAVLQLQDGLFGGDSDGVQ